MIYWICSYFGSVAIDNGGALLENKAQLALQAHLQTMEQFMKVQLVVKEEQGQSFLVVDLSLEMFTSY
jgi:hypothetical protein